MTVTPEIPSHVLACFNPSDLAVAVDASQAGAGNLEIIVSVHGRNVPNYVQSEGNARFRVNFKPQESANHILSVRFNGEPVPGERGEGVGGGVYRPV